jgi:hypothetical protein
MSEEKKSAREELREELKDVDTLYIVGIRSARAPALYISRRAIADANKAKMFIEYASMSMQAAREAFEQGDYEQAEFCSRLARFCLDKSDYYLFRYFAEKR